MGEKIFVLLTTFNRTQIALKTVESVKRNLQADFDFLVYDDGSEQGHREEIRKATSPVDMYNGERRGVGHGMNWGMRRARELGSELVLMLEDDWELLRPLSLDTHIRVLENGDVGMIRFGYLSPGIGAMLVRAEGHLWWDLQITNYQYVYAGHPSLRHVDKLHGAVGFFKEGLSPKQNELNFCGRYNAAENRPAIYWDANYGHTGPFVHIGTESIGDIVPNG